MSLTTNIQRRLSVIGGFAAVVAALIGVSAPSVYAQNRVSLESGTVIPVTLNTALSSNGSNVGDTFMAAVDTSKAAYNDIMQGATVIGVVREATPQTGNDPGTLELGFTTLRLASGQTYPISGTPTSLDSKNLTVNNNGLLVAKSTKRDDRLKFAGIGAGAVALIKVLGGDRIRIEDVLLGGLLGYGAGSIIKSPAEVHDVDLKSGTQMGVLLNSPVRYYHRTSMTGTSTSGVSSIPNTRRTFIKDGVKYFWYNGEQWGMDLTTRERFRTGNMASASRPVFHRTNRKFYMFQGHQWYLDRDTGERVQID